MNNEYDVGKAFQRIEEKLIKSMKYNLTRHLKEEKLEGMNWSMWQTEQLKALEQFKKENKSLFKNDFLNVNTEIEEMIKKNFENGKLNQENKILEAILKKNFRNYNKTSNASFLKINERKLNALIKESKSNFNKAEKAILRYTNDQYRQIIYDAQVYANTGSGTVEQAIDMATQDFLSKGINCIQYANGAMVNIASYARMAIRTANKRAYLEGEGQKRTEWGIHTVLVPNRGGGCPYCIKYQGKVFIDDVWSGGTAKESTETGYPLLSTAVKGRLFHPNCKDTAVTYFPGINSEVTPPTKQELEVKKQNYMNDQKMNYINRNIDKYKRLELGSIDSENVEKYHNKRLQWQEYKKQFNKNKEVTFSDIEEYTNIQNAIKSESLTFDKFLKMRYNNIAEYSLMKNYSDIFNHNEIPNDLTYNVYKENLTTSNWKAVGFNPKYVESHKKHLEEFGDVDWNTYENDAKELLNSKENENILGFVSKDGTRFKYDIKENRFACARKNGITQTYYKPKRKLKYWEEQKEKYGK